MDRVLYYVCGLVVGLSVATLISTLHEPPKAACSRPVLIKNDLGMHVYSTICKGVDVQFTLTEGKDE